MYGKGAPSGWGGVGCLCSALLCAGSHGRPKPVVAGSRHRGPQGELPQGAPTVPAPRGKGVQLGSGGGTFQGR